MINEYSISWKVLKSGQVGRYKDSIYEYEIKSTCAPITVKKFCTKFLYPSNHECKNEREFRGSCGFPFGLESFYNFTDKGDNNYSYKVVSPYCD